MAWSISGETGAAAWEPIILAAQRLLAGGKLGHVSTMTAAGKHVQYYAKRFFAPLMISC